MKESTSFRKVMDVKFLLYTKQIQKYSEFQHKNNLQNSMNDFNIAFFCNRGTNYDLICVKGYLEPAI